MKTIVLGMACLLFSIGVYAQTGIQFEQGLFWDQIKQKAKTAHKDILVDCYATWCGPCKQMDAEVFTDPRLGAYINDHFISVRIQMDKTAGDNKAVKDWYATADDFARTYRINAFPTFLYFSSDGMPLHRHTGSGSINDFLTWAKEAQDSTKQYYAILKHYAPGKLDTADLRNLAKGMIYNDPKLAGQLMLEYLDRGGWTKYHNAENGKAISDFANIKGVAKRVEDTVARLTLIDLSHNYYSDLLIGFRTDTVIRNKAINLILSIPDAQLNESRYNNLLTRFAAIRSVKQKVTDYFHSLSNASLRKKDNIILLMTYWQLIKPDSRYFPLFYQEAAQTEQLAGLPAGAIEKGNYVFAALINNLIVPIINSADSAGREPDWRLINTKLEVFVDAKLADRYTNMARSSYYKGKIAKAIAAHSPEEFSWGKKRAAICLIPWTDQRIKQIAPKDLLTCFGLNNDCWDVFLYSDESKLLKRAVQLQKAVISLCPEQGDFIDTYANLLYKLGQKKEALSWEAKAMALHPNFQPLINNYNAMKQGKITWPTPEHPEHN